LDLTKIKPYGDTLNDGKVQVSFTLPLQNNERSVQAARILAEKMGLDEPHVVFSKALDENFTFFILYGTLKHDVNYNEINISITQEEVFDMEQTNQFIMENIGRKIVVLGASTGTDAHTVGIDAIMNMKGYAGHYGLERYEMIEAINLGSQVENEVFVQKAKEFNADVLLVSQTVSQKNIHIQNLTELVELLEAEGIRKKVVLICGGPRISNQLAKELGYDAGFGEGKFADDVATYAVKEIARRK
jgi:beta-lysine 5,6-aminomutase beta subunit